MSRNFFITGISTGIGKTMISAILTEALQADYWKPVQAGYAEGTDSEWVQGMITNKKSVIHKEAYKLKLPASPHIAAREENVHIDLEKIVAQKPVAENLIIEGAGGLMVPLNENEFVADLIKKLDAEVILVSKNELGSINHSLLTARVCKQYGLNVAGWIFNGNYLDYEVEIVGWSGFPRIASIPFSQGVNKSFVLRQAELIRHQLDLFHE